AELLDGRFDLEGRLAGSEQHLARGGVPCGALCQCRAWSEGESLLHELIYAVRKPGADPGVAHRLDLRDILRRFLEGFLQAPKIGQRSPVGNLRLEFRIETSRHETDGGVLWLDLVPVRV